MMKKYRFFDAGEIMFESSKTVKELIEYAFEEFDYYEPLGMDIVTIFQTHHSASSSGWFTTDTSRTCDEEIENCNELCFAYFLPNVFYFAEGGWGHHMTSLGNHPKIKNPVSLWLRFEDFDHSVVINGEYSFTDIVKYLQRGDYLPKKVKQVSVWTINPTAEPYTISLTDKIMRVPLTQFAKSLPDAVTIIEIQ